MELSDSRDIFHKGNDKRAAGLVEDADPTPTYLSIPSLGDAQDPSGNEDVFCWLQTCRLTQSPDLQGCQH